VPVCIECIAVVTYLDVGVDHTRRRRKHPLDCPTARRCAAPPSAIPAKNETVLTFGGLTQNGNDRIGQVPPPIPWDLRRTSGN
jgi:hypothetical protein